MSSPEVQRELGEHDARLAHLEEEVKGLRVEVKQVLAILNQTKGSWKTLVAIAGMSSAVGALAAKLFPLAVALPR